MLNPVNNSYNCLMCLKPVALAGSQKHELQHYNKEIEHKEETIKNEPIKITERKKPQLSRSDEVSKQMSNRLLQGWAMLERVCDGTQPYN
jgi:hypothetical protein